MSESYFKRLTRHLNEFAFFGAKNKRKQTNIILLNHREDYFESITSVINFFCITIHRVFYLKNTSGGGNLTPPLLRKKYLFLNH